MLNIIVIITIALFIIVAGIVSIIAGRVSKQEFYKTGKHPKGYYIGLGMAIGMSLGMAIGVAIDMIAIGPGIGAGIGVALGNSLEKKHAKELREPTAQEIKTKKMSVMFILGLLALTVVAILMFYRFLK